MEEQSQLEELQKTLQEQGSKSEDVSTPGTSLTLQTVSLRLTSPVSHLLSVR